MDVPSLMDVFEESIRHTREWVLRDFDELHKNPPPILYHYTKNEGLIGILGGQYPSIRATHAAFLNDPRELIYAEEVLREFFTKRRTNWDDSNKSHAKLYDALLSLLPQIRQRRDIYVFSLSQHDDHLSQWQAYAAGGYGYTIGFLSSELQAIYPSSPESIFLRRIIYNKEHEQWYFLNKLADGIDDFVNEIDEAVDTSGQDISRDNLLTMAALFIAEAALEEFLVCYKHEAFKGEAEWRLCVMNRPHIPGVRKSEPTPGVDFVGARGRLTPYVPIPMFEPTNQVARFVKSVRLGPALDTTIDKRTLELFLRRWNLQTVEVLESNIRLK